MCGDGDRSLLFRGWSRLCLHAAASLSAFEGASTAANAASRGSRAEAVTHGATTAADKTETGRHVAEASADVAAEREQAQMEGEEEEADASTTLVPELKRKTFDTEQVSRHQQARRAKMLVRAEVNDGRRKQSIAL